MYDCIFCRIKHIQINDYVFPIEMLHETLFDSSFSSTLKKVHCTCPDLNIEFNIGFYFAFPRHFRVDQILRIKFIALAPDLNIEFIIGFYFASLRHFRVDQI